MSSVTRECNPKILEVFYLDQCNTRYLFQREFSRKILICNALLISRLNRSVSRAVTRSSLGREVWDSNLGLVKSDAVLPTFRLRFDISLEETVLPGRNDAEMGPANSLHVSAYYIEYNKRFDNAAVKYRTKLAMARLYILYSQGFIFESCLAHSLRNFVTYRYFSTPLRACDISSEGVVLPAGARRGEGLDKLLKRFGAIQRV